MKKLKIVCVYLFFIYVIYIMCTQFNLISQSVKNSIDLCVSVIIPSLFPFFVISDLMMDVMSKHTFGKVIEYIYERIFKFSKSTIPIFITGLISGYPVGASVVMSAYEDGYISKNDAEDLICFTNNSGPLFIICSVGIGIFNNIKLGLILYIIHIISAVITGFIISLTRKREKYISYNYISLGKDITLLIEEAFFKCLKICGFVIFFSIINRFIKTIFINVPKLSAMISVIIEITNGIVAVSNIFNSPMSIYLTAFALGWSGVSVLLQVNAVCKRKLSLKKYTYYKLLNGLISYVLCLILINTTVKSSLTYNTEYKNIFIIGIIVTTYIIIYYFIKKFCIQKQSTD